MSKAKRLLAVMCSMALLLSGAVRTGHAVLAEEAEESLIPTEEVMSMEETSGQEEAVPAAEAKVEETVSEVKQIAPEPEPAVAEEPVKQPSATEEAPAEVPAEDQKAPETTEPTEGAEKVSSEVEQEASADMPSGEAKVIPEAEETSEEESAEEEPAGENQPEAQPATETETVIPDEDQAAVPEQEKPEETIQVSETASDPVVLVTEPKEIPVVEVDGVSVDILIGSETTMVVLKSSVAGTALVTLNKVPGLVLKGEDKKEVSPVGSADPDMLSYELKVRFGETEIFLSASTEATVNIQASLQKEPGQSETKQTSVKNDETASSGKPESADAEEQEQTATGVDVIETEQVAVEEDENETEEAAPVVVIETEKIPAADDDAQTEEAAQAETVIETEKTTDNDSVSEVAETAQTETVIETEKAPGMKNETEEEAEEAAPVSDDEADLTGTENDEEAEADPSLEGEPVENEEAENTDTDETEPAEDNTAGEEDYVETEGAGQPAERSVTFEITYDNDESHYGEFAHFKAVLTGYDELEYVLTWQKSEDGENWIDTEVHDLLMDVEITEENCALYWRVNVEVFEEDNYEETEAASQEEAEQETGEDSAEAAREESGTETGADPEPPVPDETPTESQDE